MPDWAQRKAEIDLQHGSGPVNPSALHKSAPPDRNDVRNAEIKRRFESGETTTPATGGESAPIEVSAEEFQATESLRQEMGDYAYQQLEQDARLGLSSIFKTQEAMEETVRNFKGDFKKVYRFLAEHGASLRRR